MRCPLLVVAVSLLWVHPAWGGDTPESTQNETCTDGSLEGAWVVTIPSGSSDYFSGRYDGLAGRPLRGVSIGAADFGTADDFPFAGLFDANLSLDASGNTPDLGSGWSAGPVAPGGSVYDYRYVSLGGLVYPATEPQHVVVQFPAGDPGLLGVGGDTSRPVSTPSGWSADGFASPAIEAPVIWGLNANIDAITELNAAGTDGRLRCYLGSDDQTGDISSIVVHTGDPFGVVFFAPATGTRWMLFKSIAGMPLVRSSGVLPTTADAPGGFLRQGTLWPSELGPLVVTLVAVSGVPGVPGTVGTSDEIEFVAPGGDGCGWGIKDDGSYEQGYFVQIPAGSADYFNVNFNCGSSPGISEITSFQLAVMDFGTAQTAFPVSGIYPSNYAIDPGATTPDLGTPYETAPMTFPSGVFATSWGAIVERTLDTPVPYASLVDDNVHGAIQFPPGDSGALAIGADTNSTSGSSSAWTIDGYASAAYPFVYKPGLRLGSR